MKTSFPFLGESLRMSGKASYHGTKGTLYLTNRRLAFVYKKRGLISESKHTPVNLPLDSISEITMTGIGPFKRVAIHTYKDKLLSGLPRYEFKVHNPETWTVKIEEACTSFTPGEAMVPTKCTVCGIRIENSQAECPVCGAHLA